MEDVPSDNWARRDGNHDGLFVCLQVFRLLKNKYFTHIEIQLLINTYYDKAGRNSDFRRQESENGLG
ncbi:hypothetical protein GCM10010967_18650 [Dyadobacter beijingensis]|uniref:Uncharacterized protein n=1 Tax=Dyadobacter beijingensis TaxID=365489 RepID=A0ABQ2HPP9_9BACT|nr:hypothetical protein GCM10010967_18650 [Dyadobacter beijingensis]